MCAPLPGPTRCDFGKMPLDNPRDAGTWISYKH